MGLGRYSQCARRSVEDPISRPVLKQMPTMFSESDNTIAASNPFFDNSESTLDVVTL